MFQPRPVESPIPEPADEVGRQHLGRRLAAIRMAVENLPRQAKRLARWQARRNRMQGFIFRSPLRPGPPPGHRKEPEDEIDLVLIRWHALAWEALNEDTSVEQSVGLKKRVALAPKRQLDRAVLQMRAGELHAFVAHGLVVDADGAAVDVAAGLAVR
ncbi:hypothetical protein BH10PSE7_BH10PSE7_40200 [soil metagenome]